MVEQKSVKFVGWIYGNPDDRDILIELGVTGEMIYHASDNSNVLTIGAHKKSGYFSHCIITKEVAITLKANYPTFQPRTFTWLR
jgi:hypothetical protein